MLGKKDIQKLDARIADEVSYQIARLVAGTTTKEAAIAAVANQIGYHHPNGATPSEEARAAKLLAWTCPGEDAGHCDSAIRGEYEGPCEGCPLCQVI